MRGIILITLGGVIQLPATLNGSLVAAIVLGISIGAIMSVLIGIYILEKD